MLGRVKMMRKVLVTIITLLLVTSPVLAQTYDICQDNQTVLHIREVTLKISPINITRFINITEPEKCWFGCVDNACVYPPWVSYAIVLGLVIFAAIVYLLFFRGEKG